MEKLSRRSFFRLAGGGIAAVMVAPSILLDKVINIPVEFGWTWFVDKSKLEPSLAKLVSKTLTENTQELYNNLGSNNALLAKLSDGTKVQLNITRITEQEQIERIKKRSEVYIKQKEEARLEKLFKERNLSEENKAFIRKRSEEALTNKIETQNKHRVMLESDMNTEQRVNHYKNFMTRNQYRELCKNECIS